MTELTVVRPENKQPPEKVDTAGHALDIVDVFQTIQGEGPFAGRPAVFVRLAGCNLRCRLCDTDYTTGRRLVEPDDLFDLVMTTASKGTTLLVLTGGEPFRQNPEVFVRLMLHEGWQVQVETNGTLPPSRDFPLVSPNLSIVCSPKTPHLSPALVHHIKAVKYVVEAGQTDPDNGLPVSVLGAPVVPARVWPMYEAEPHRIYVQPCDGRTPEESKANLDEAVQVCQKYGYTLSVQMHKVIGVP